MSKPQVLITGPLPKEYAQKELEELVGAKAEIVYLQAKTESEFKDLLSSTLTNLKVVYHFGGPTFLGGAIGEKQMAALPESCKTICHFGAGYDDVDVSAATSHGVQVSHTPGAVDDATATTAVFLILSAMRLFYRAEVECRKGNWKKNLPLARDPELKTLGIIGMGGIGKVVARRMIAGWGMKVLYYNRNEIPKDKLDFECEYVGSQEELLKRSDVVSLHMPLNAKTEKSFGTKQFEAMKEGAVLVNTARGGVIDEPALLSALRSKKLFAAGLDVFPNEPSINPELYEFENVTLLPHMGTETTDSRHKMGMVVVKNILKALDGEALVNLVPEQQK